MPESKWTYRDVGRGMMMVWFLLAVVFGLTAAAGLIMLLAIWLELTRLVEGLND
jgi:hypothetical protein